jgi:hypothetical protein
MSGPDRRISKLPRPTARLPSIRRSPPVIGSGDCLGLASHTYVGLVAICQYAREKNSRPGRLPSAFQARCAFIPNEPRSFGR